MKRLSFFLFLVIGSCIDPLNLKNTPEANAIVVDGLITDQPGPYEVKVYQTIKISDQLDTIHYIGGATLTITDDAGGSEVLTEVSKGHYQTRTTVGTVGKTYTLHIRTSTGDTYESSPEELLPVGDISNLRYEFLTTGLLITPGDLSTQDGFIVYLDADLEPEQKGRVRWRWTGTYEVDTYPQYITKLQAAPPGPPIEIPDPPPCSGYAYYAQPMYDETTGITTYKWVFKQVDTCSCCKCWDSEFNLSPLLSKKDVSGNTTVLSGVKVAFITATSWHLADKYVLEVDQMSCSQAVYDFWQRIEQQEGQSSDLFQTPPAATSGNISATSKNAYPVIGVFGASGLKKQMITFTSHDAPYQLETLDSLAIECFNVFSHTSVVKPPFW